MATNEGTAEALRDILARDTTGEGRFYGQRGRGARCVSSGYFGSLGEALEILGSGAKPGDDITINGAGLRFRIDIEGERDRPAPGILPYDAGLAANALLNESTSIIVVAEDRGEAEGPRTSAMWAERAAERIDAAERIIPLTTDPERLRGRVTETRGRLASLIRKRGIVLGEGSTLF